MAFTGPNLWPNVNLAVFIISVALVPTDGRTRRTSFSCSSISYNTNRFVFVFSAIGNSLSCHQTSSWPFSVLKLRTGQVMQKPAHSLTEKSNLEHQNRNSC